MSNLIFRRSNLIGNYLKLLKPKSPYVISCQNLNKDKFSYEDPYEHYWYENRHKIIAVGGVFATLVSFAVYKYHVSCTSDCQRGKKVEDLFPEFGANREDLPKYTLKEVQEHDSEKKRIWVIFREGVYDITDFIPSHPGAQNILMAAGNSVEPFWKTYSIHYRKEVLELLETFRIGNIDLNESKEIILNVFDPYQNEPKNRSKFLKPASNTPFNAEPYPAKLLVENFYTPNNLFYVRNHLPVPQIEIENYELEVQLDSGGSKNLTLSFEDLKKLPKYTVDATIMCAGNRRSEMIKIKEVKGLNWGFAAIGNAKWSGAKLRDVLIKAGIKEDDSRFKHVHFHGHDLDPASAPYNVSIPLHKAMDKYGDVLLAYEMNGKPLTPDHGFPIRVVVPGTAGARNVKWLQTIVVSKDESEGFWQQKDYKGFSPSDTWETADFSKAQAIQGLPVISAICSPEENENIKVSNGFLTVKGYAYSGGGNKILRVDVTLDKGKTWTTAELEQNSDQPPRHYSWSLWKAKIPIEKKGNFSTEIWVKAVDSNYNTQPENFENIWNIRGVLNNAYHRVPINIQN